MPGSRRGRGKSRKERSLAGTGCTKGQHCLGESSTPGALEGCGAGGGQSQQFPWLPSWVASLFALAEVE